jgi:hypothetical protein
MFKNLNNKCDIVGGFWFAPCDIVGGFWFAPCDIVGGFWFAPCDNDLLSQIVLFWE